MTEVEAPKKGRPRPATDRQKEFAGDLGIQFDEGISAREISAMIDAALDREEAMDRGEIEVRLKTLRNCDEGGMLDELSKRGFHAFIVSWPMEDESGASTELHLTGADGVTLEFIRYVFLQILTEHAKQEGVDLDDPGDFVKFLAKSAKKPKSA